jgi:hypothetical protein
MAHAAFTIEKEMPDYIFILDTGPWDQHRTITNDPEWVIETLANDHALGDRRLFYKDSEGQIDELLHAAGRFTGYKAGHEGIHL